QFVRVPLPRVPRALDDDRVLWCSDAHGVPPSRYAHNTPAGDGPAPLVRNAPCIASGHVRRPPWMDGSTPLRTAEFLVVDTETNGLAGDACELTEIGAVLVGGGELHERWETLAR